MKKYIVELTDEERSRLTKIIRTGKNGAETNTRARILLKADESKFGPAWIDKKICEALNVCIATVERTRKKLVEQGLDATLYRKKYEIQQSRRKLDGYGEAQLIALMMGDKPAGRGDWSLRLLADKLVELEIVDEISYETVRQTLKKTNSNHG